MRRGAGSLHRHRAALVACAALAVLALAACSDSEEGAPQIEASPTPTPLASEATPTPTESATRTPTPTSTPVEVLNTLWLVDAASGEVETLYEGPSAVYSEAFQGDTAVFGTVERGLRRVSLDGDVLGAVEGRCQGTADGVVLDGAPYEGISCGPISPDGRYMAFTTAWFQEDLEYGYGVVDLETHEGQLIRTDMADCGGCDFRYGPAWSPSGRFLVISEFGGDGRIFLADIQEGRDRVIGHGNQTDDAPQWSSSTDVLAMASAGGAWLVDADTREEDPTPVPWPARWDRTGRYLYAPGWVWQPSSVTGPLETAIYDTVTGASQTLPGVPPGVHLWTDTVAVVGMDGGYSAALEHAEGCRGVRVTSVFTPAVTCVEGALGAVISPDGTRVAMLVDTGERVAAQPPNTGQNTMVEYRLVILDIATGTQVEAGEVALGYQGSFGGESAPPAITWNEAGTHLLVRWPAAYGI